MRRLGEDAMSDLNSMVADLQAKVGERHPMNKHARHHCFDGDSLTELLDKYIETKSLYEDAEDQLNLWEFSKQKEEMVATEYYRNLKKARAQASMMRTALEMVLEEINARMSPEWQQPE